ncbi:SDR family oxidoreductase [Candidatus Mycobacterium wuenschmannii]|uniref:SDR family oxidoreductase n=1 Tax=Candidatus Mycobacterium wuenschmannii TaxID=3027808 RepID=A0ABY8VWY9_9MYCO|nr:SDR family oxidoreductase [Candidatus Mycobacterium wuenschmannii]WIM86692.1 SDR family oxidoreductase [Candidatus Mycobacterium wuenschmannii]
MRTALITGASRGIGAAIADALAPTHTLLLAGRPSPALQATAEQLGATTLPLDVTDADAIADATATIGELDVLVHNAGVSLPGRIAESTVEQWRTTFDVNVVGAVAVTLALLPALRKAHGQVVFINSGSGRKASENMASYSASKFALRAFADSLRLSEPDLRVTTVYPGRTDTDMQRELVSYEGGDYDAAKFLRAETVAAAVAQAVATPPDGHLQEVILRPRG